jgi:hypothetical protein
MQNDFSENDPRAIWQNQTTEPSVMTSERIRQKVRKLQATTRTQLGGNLFVLLIVVAFERFGAKQFPPLEPLFLFALVWSAAGMYFLNRGMWSAAMPGDAALSTGLEFYRREIQRRRQFLRRLLLWSFGPVLLAIAAFLLSIAMGASGRGIFPNATPFMALVVIWIAASVAILVREQRQLRREIDRLDDLERQNRA